ncbi:MAG: TetR/AcrR family transcriptional regulator [Pseudomonadales bacterium]|nr:TetR/AcrR family transcriptional regulator [Pseudomonadales bacterium]
MTKSKVIQFPEPVLQSRLPQMGDGADLAQQIIDAFSEHARVVGIRSISMAKLARQLRISTKTLYKYFENKGELVHELVVLWEKRIHKPISFYGTDLIEVLRYWVKVWIENDAEFSTAFWNDLKSDYPRLYQVYVDSLYNRMAAMKARLTPYLKTEINHEFAWSSYFILMTASSQPKTFERIGMTREQCVYEAFNFWINGAVDLAKLRADQNSEKPKQLNR